MKLRIVSDDAGLRVLTPDGQEIQGVQALSINACGPAAPEALVVLQPVELDITIDGQMALEQLPGLAVDLPVEPEDIRALLPEIPHVDNPE